MHVSQKSQYALRAIFELSKYYGQQDPVKITAIAQSQYIPEKFLEVILSQLKHSGIVSSRRGKNGGYYLAKHPRSISISEVLNFTQGVYNPVACIEDVSGKQCPRDGDCVFLPIWEEARKAVTAVYDSVTFQDLLDREREKQQKLSFCYTI